MYWYAVKGRWQYTQAVLQDVWYVLTLSSHRKVAQLTHDSRPKLIDQDMKQKVYSDGLEAFFDKAAELLKYHNVKLEIEAHYRLDGVLNDYQNILDRV